MKLRLASLLPFPPVLAAVLPLALHFSTVRADTTAEPKTFANPSGMLDEAACVQFLLTYLDKPWAEVVPAPGKMPTPASMLKAVQAEYVFIKLAAGNQPPPYTIAQVSAVYPTKPKAIALDAETPAWQKVPPLTEAYQIKKSTITHADGTTTPQVLRGGASDVRLQQKAANDALVEGDEVNLNSEDAFGPLRLRRSASLRNLASLDKAEGAKVSFSNNRLVDGNGAWSSEGALFFPITGLRLPSDTETWEWALAPAASWNLQEQEKPGASDVNEMKFSLPLWLRWQPGGEDVAADGTNAHYVSAEPYYHTDTGFDGEIIGATASYEYQGPFLFGSRLGEYQAIGKFDKKYLAWRWRIIPQLDYNEVRQGSEYIQRAEGDHWLRIGGEAALDFRFFDDKSPLTASVSYKFMDTLDGEGGYSDLFKASVSLWLNKFTGLTLEYQKGQTPVANQDIDLLTLGMQLRY